MNPSAKQLYRISQVSAMLNLPVSTIKYWTDTFEEIRPTAIGTGRQVKYRTEDIETIKLIKVLMHDRKMQIEGAKKHLASCCAPYNTPKCKSTEDAIKLLSEVKVMVADNPRAVSMIDSVQTWVKNCENFRKN